MYEKERIELAEILFNRGIKDKTVLRAVSQVERHKFVAPSMQFHAYKDTALPIGKGQTISQPYTVAFMTEKLMCKKGDRVLEIGTGSGYQAAILCAMGIQVYTIERHYELYETAVKLFEKLNIPALVRCADGTIGWNDYAPYKGIIVTAGSPSIPQSLKNQLAIGGRLIVPVGDKSGQAMNIITRDSEVTFTTEIVTDFAFVPLIGREGWKTE